MEQNWEGRGFTGITLPLYVGSVASFHNNMLERRTRALATLIMPDESTRNRATIVIHQNLVSKLIFRGVAEQVIRTFLSPLQFHFYENWYGKDENNNVSSSIDTRREKVHCHHVPATLDAQEVISFCTSIPVTGRA